MADQSSNNPYIRTYAKDVAEAQGKPLPEGTAAAPAPGTSTETSADREAVLARLRERAAADPVHEGDLLPPTLPTPVAKAESTNEPLPEIPLPVPPPVVLEPRVPAAPPPPEPVPPAIVPSPAPVVVPPPPPPPPPTPRPEPGPERMHTYSSDFSNRIDSNEASAFSVLAAQADAGALAPQTVTARKHSNGPIFAVAGVALILVAGGGAFGVYEYVASHSVVPTAPTVPSLVFADDRQIVSGEGSALIDAITASSQSALPENQVRVLYLTQASTTPDGKKVIIPLSGGTLIGALQLSAPDILLRNVADESTVGIVHAGDETRPFFILKVLSYERTFAGMLQWEGTIESSLQAFYPEYPAPPPPEPTIATTTKIVNGKKVTATTTIPAPTTVDHPPRFVDEIASNHDVRALKDAQNRTILLYGYKDKDVLIIARDEAAFAELINRLSATKQQ